MAIEIVKIHKDPSGVFRLPASRELGNPAIADVTEKKVVDRLGDWLFAAAASGQIPAQTGVHVFGSRSDAIHLQLPPAVVAPKLAAE